MTIVLDIKKIESLRGAAGYPTHEAFAAAIGMGRANYSRLVNDIAGDGTHRVDTRLSTLARICTALKIANPSEILAIDLEGNAPSQKVVQRNAQRRRKYAAAKASQLDAPAPRKRGSGEH